MKPNKELENLLDTLYPKGRSATITLDLAAFNKHVDLFFAMQKEVNTAAEKARVDAAVKETAAKEVAKPVPKPVEREVVQETKVEKATNKKGGK